MKTYQECVIAYDDSVPHRNNSYMRGFLDAIAFIYGVPCTKVLKDTESYRSERYHEEEDDSGGLSN
ncbi:MAG: hypothetical protein WBX25_15220 [Rhodomicrobium sp.]